MKDIVDPYNYDPHFQIRSQISHNEQTEEFKKVMKLLEKPDLIKAIRIVNCDNIYFLENQTMAFRKVTNV